MKKRYLYLFNTVFTTMTIFLVILLYNVQTKRVKDSVITGFNNSVESIKTIINNYFDQNQTVCKSWAKYLNITPHSYSQAVEFLKNSSIDDCEIQLVDISTGEAYSVISDQKYKYTDREAVFLSNGFIELCEKDRGGQHILTDIKNSYTMLPSIAFAELVTLYDSLNSTKDYLLLKIETLDKLRTYWVFPLGYEQAQLLITTETTDYIFSSSLFKYKNFSKYVGSFNNLDYSQQQNLVAQMNYKGSGSLTFKNSFGDTGYFYYTKQSDTGRFVIGYIPEKCFVPIKSDLYTISIIIEAFLVMFVINGYYILKVNKELIKSNNMIQSENKEKTIFLTSLSHNLRTPLNAITGLTDIAEHSIDDSTAVKECLKKINASSKHIINLMSDILDISNVEQGILSLNPEAINLSVFFKDILSVASPLYSQKKQIFSVHLHSIICECVYSDSLRLYQAFINVLENAIKFTHEKGSITVDLIQEQGSSEDFIKLTYIVTDNGPGISRDFLQSIYDSFDYKDNNRSSYDLSIGLGLTLTKRIIDTMNGTMKIESELKKGTTVTIELELQKVYKMQNNLSLPQVNVLLIDKDIQVLESAQKMLQSMEISADTCNIATTAIELIAKNKTEGKNYKVIIMDWDMPVIGGKELTEQIKKVSGPDTAIIVASAYDTTKIKFSENISDISAFIQKPMFKSSLYQVIVNTISHKSSEKLTNENTKDLKGLNVLIAEDDDLNWEIMERMLKFHHINAERAKNGLECVNILHNSPLDKYTLIFMDVQMPVMNGLEAAQKIRNSEIREISSIPIIAVTADAYTDDINECLKAGMNGHIAKPIDIHIVIEQIRKAKLTNT